MTTVHTYHLGAVKPWVQSAADDLGNRFDFSNIGGYRAHGSVPNSDHPKGLALDFMTFNKSKAERLIAYAIENASALGITYIIYNRRIWQNGEWKAYHGPNPHIDHVHISFSDKGGSGGSTSQPGIATVGYEIPILGDLEKASARLQDPVFWNRLGMYALGFALVCVGIFILLRKPIQSTAVQVAKVVA